MKIKIIFFIVFCVIVIATTHTYAQPLESHPTPSEQLKDPRAADVTILGHILEPKKLAPENLLPKIALPEGFEISIFAQDLINPRMIAVADSGAVYVTRRDVGDVIKLTDADGDGKADHREVVANRPGMHGIAIAGNTVYLATVNDLYKATIEPNGRFTPLVRFVDDLPDGGQHPNRTLALGPDGKLYVSVGSTCNACAETNPESATLLQMNTDGSARKIFASGLRNTVGFAFEPNTGELYGMDHGIDWLGDNEQYEELNHIVQGKQYGWPYIYDDSKFNPQDEPPGDISMEEWAARSIEPLGYYTPHAAPMQMLFYTGSQFPPQYRGDAFIAMRGSWNRKPPAGYEVARVEFNGGRPSRFHSFVQGFLAQEEQEGDTQWVHYGRLAGLAQAKDGSLLLADDTNGIIYRIAYTGTERNTPPLGPPTHSENVNLRILSAGLLTPDEVHMGSLAVRLVPGSSQQFLSLDSPAFVNGGPIPARFAAEGENISPPLTWRPGPEATRSYAVIMEDPDVAQNPPFVHWLLYNIPPDVLALPKGIPPLSELVKPKGARQGKNDRGSIGYTGPNPPPADATHGYYFQVFALDKMLELPLNPTREELLAAMQGHVLSSGFYVGAYDR